MALRYPRGEGIGVPLPARPEAIEIGTGEILREGERVALLGYGSGVGKALEAADILAEHGISVTVADARFAKPIDAGPRRAARRRARAARHRRGGRARRWLRLGGLGDACPMPDWERAGRAPSSASACPTAMSPTARPALLHEEVGFTGERIAERIESAVAECSGVPTA